jgi:hypothetical protein
MEKQKKKEKEKRRRNWFGLNEEIKKDHTKQCSGAVFFSGLFLEQFL